MSNFNNHTGSYGVNKKVWTLQNKFKRIYTSWLRFTTPT